MSCLPPPRTLRSSAAPFASTLPNSVKSGGPRHPDRLRQCVRGTLREVCEAWRRVGDPSRPPWSDAAFSGGVILSGSRLILVGHAGQSSLVEGVAVSAHWVEGATPRRACCRVLRGRADTADRLLRIPSGSSYGGPTGLLELQQEVEGSGARFAIRVLDRVRAPGPVQPGIPERFPLSGTGAVSADNNRGSRSSQAFGRLCRSRFWRNLPVVLHSS